MTEQTDGVERPVKRSAWLERLGYLACGALLGAIAAVTLIEGTTWAVGELKMSFGTDNASSQVGRSNGESFALAKDEMAARLEAAEKEHREHIDKELEHTKMLLDGLVAMVGVYTALLGVTAFLTLKLSRDEAKEQIRQERNSIDRELKAARETGNEALAKFQKDINRIHEAFPQFQEMDRRMEQRLRQIKLRIPSPSGARAKSTWYRQLTDEDHQFIAESVIAIEAYSVFGLELNPKLKEIVMEIYGRFARYFADGSVSSGHSDAAKNNGGRDYVRAISYATRVIELNSEDGKGYRLRGAIALDRFLFLRDTGGGSEDDRKKLLDAAEKDLDEAIEKSSDADLDTGAYYNLALVKYCRSELLDAVKLSRQLLSKHALVRTEDREYFLPSFYRNLGCYLALIARKAAADGKEAEVKKYSTEAVDAIRMGVNDFLRTRTLDGGLEDLQSGIKKELLPGGDFSSLELGYKQQLEALARATD